MSEKVHLVLDVVAESASEHSLSQQLVEVVTDQVLAPRIVQLRCDRINETESFVRLAQEQCAAVRAQPKIPCPQLHATVECSLEERFARFTHQINSRFRVNSRFLHE